MTIQEQTEQLEKIIVGHKAHNNAFFDAIKNKKTSWNKKQLSIIGPQYYHFTSNFPKSLSKLVARVSSDKTRNLLVQILYSELGGRKYKKAHHQLFYKALSTAGVEQSIIEHTEIFKETTALVLGIDKLFSDAPLPSGLGAEYALEVHANPMIAGLCDGFDGVDLEFFKVHAVDEPRHIINVRECLLDDPCVKDNWPEVKSGASEILKLFHEFWIKLHNETLSLTNPTGYNADE